MATALLGQVAVPVAAAVAANSANRQPSSGEVRDVNFALTSRFLGVKSAGKGSKQTAQFTPAGVMSSSQRAPKEISAVAAPSTATPSTAFEKVDFKKLQNGSDIRGIAIDGVEGEAVNLTEEAAEAIAAGYAKFLASKRPAGASGEVRVSIGTDSRITGPALQAAVARGLASEGVKVVTFGLASTPAMFNSTIVESEELLCPAEGAIMITASHLPFNRNGLKFFTKSGGANKGDISAILANAAEVYSGMTPETVKANSEKAAAATTSVDFMKRYSADLVDAVRRGAKGIERPLEGFHIVVDAGNGAGGFFAANVLEPLGATTDGSQFLDPDGMFPNHIPNPEDKKAMEMITDAVKANKADLGIIFDTDVDRSAAVDSSGREINRNRLIALMAALVLEEHPGTTVVTDSVTSEGLTTFIEKKLGGRHHRFKRGYKNVIDEGIRLNSVGEECHLAIETSGHGALKENNWLDDGAYLMVKLLVKLAQAAASGPRNEARGVLTRMIEDLVEADVTTELRFKIDQTHPDIPEGGFREYGERVIAALEKEVAGSSKLVRAPVDYEGVRVTAFGGWFLLRLSLHDPVLPLNLEAPTEEAAKQLGQEVLRIVNKFPALDITALEKYLA
eukprot:TRINITY_DN26386_c0_g1_i1.p1 TRINITY_DN26386_c0_g1~~TRINITY_DN26386_c0_g1_i1.p1  ORF type:complete len:620 (+),score=157.58 TRINITY_DN26386_c0_g1_i1:87-1946(+)